MNRTRGCLEVCSHLAAFPSYMLQTTLTASTNFHSVYLAKFGEPEPPIGLSVSGIDFLEVDFVSTPMNCY